MDQLGAGYSMEVPSPYIPHFILVNPCACVSRVIVVGLSFCRSFCHFVILSSCHYARFLTNDKCCWYQTQYEGRESQSLCSDGLFLLFMVLGDGKRAYIWIDDTQHFSQTTTADDTKLDMKDEGHGLYPLMCYSCRR